jgi:hypothetical protein
MRGIPVETIFVSQTGWCSTFETSSPACLEPNETLSTAFGCLQLAQASRYGMRAGADDCKLMCRQGERAPGHLQ